jgi:hypothetical protein
MRLNEFKTMSRQEQLDLLQAQGLYVGKIAVNGRPTILFQLSDFYVEIIYLKYRTYIQQMHISSDISLLDPYLEQVDIFHLLPGSKILPAP